MKNVSQDSVCARAEDVLLLLYDEASTTQRRELTRHLADCGLCRQDLADFQGVRADVSLWHSAITRTAPAQIVPLTAQTAWHNVPRPRSARAAWDALREFFTLAPVWLRGATAFASVLLAALLGFAAFALNRPAVTVATAPVITAPATNDGISESELQTRLASAVQAEREKLQAQYEQQLAAQAKPDNAAYQQRLAALQNELAQTKAQARRTVTAPRVVVAKNAPATTTRQAAPATTKNQPRRNTPAATLSDEEEATLAEVLFGGK